MSRTLNIISNNVQGYGPSESTSLPWLGVSGRAVSVSTCPRNECKFSPVKISLKCCLKHVSFICKASAGGHRRNPDFPRHNRSGYSRNRNRLNEERDSAENLDESEFISTKNGPLLSLSNSPKSHATAAPGPREREIVELFRKVQAQLRQRAFVKEEKKFDGLKGQNKESETVDSLLKLLRKHSVEQGKRKVNGGSASEFSFDQPKQSVQSNEDKNRSFFNSNSIVREEPQENNKPSYSRPPSEFRRRSPVPRVKYEPIVSHSDVDEKTNETLTETELESDSYLEPDMDLVSGLELDQEEEREEEVEVELETEADFVDEPTVSKLSEAELLGAEEDDYDAKNAEKEHTEPKDFSAMKLTELKEIAKARGMKGFSKLKKSELVGLLSEDSM